MSSLLLAPPSAAIRLGAVANEIKVPAVQHCLCYPGFSVQKDLEKVLFQQARVRLRSSCYLQLVSAPGVYRVVLRRSVALLCAGIDVCGQ